MYSLGYAFWYECSTTDLQYMYEWDGTYQLAGLGPDVADELAECMVPSDLILLHGPAPR